MRAIKLNEMVASGIDDDAILGSIAASIKLGAAARKKFLSSYDAYRRQKGSNTISPLHLQEPWVEVLYGLYKGRTQKDGLAWIDKIANTTRYGYCPMCGAETHKTVEHFLPRSPWAEFSFFSHNLVPSCGPCNSKRGNRASAPNATPLMLHPYFDHAVLRRRLHITRIVPPYEAPDFVPDVCTGLGKKLAKRVENHLSHSIELVPYQQFCTNRWSELRITVVRKRTLASCQAELAELLRTALLSSGPNSWRTAFYAGAANDPAIAQWLFANRKK